MKRFLTFALLLLISVITACDKGGGGQEPAVRDAIFFGDSITANWVKESKGHPEFFSENNFLCLGFSGKTTAYMKTVLKGITDKHPRQLVILGGTNDIAQNDGVYVSIEETRNNIAWMALEAKKAGIKVVICSVLPSKNFYWAPSIHPEQMIVDLNALLKAFAEDNGFAYADYHSALADAGNGLPSKYTADGCHPNQAGYTVMEGIILPILKSNQ